MILSRRDEKAALHDGRPRTSLRDVPDYVRGSRQHRDRRERDPPRPRPIEHAARPRAVSVRVSLSALSDFRRLDWRSRRTSPDVVPVRRHLGRRDDAHRSGRRPADVVSRARPARRRRGRHVPRRDARDADVDAAGPSRLRSGNHARLRQVRQHDHAADRRVAHRAADVAGIVRDARVFQPHVGHRMVLVLPGQSRGTPGNHSRRARPVAESRRSGS